MDREKLTEPQRLNLADALESYRAPSNHFYRFAREAWEHAFPYAYVDCPHVELLCNYLEPLGRGEISRLLINLPPSCSKSGIVSVLYPAWVWTFNPQAEFLCMSYHENLTIRDSVRCRNLIGSAWYQSQWGKKVQIKPGSDAKGLYELTAGGKRVSTTRGGLGTGLHPSHVVVDDPLSALQAQRKSERDAVNEWRNDTLSSRGIARDVSQCWAFQRFHVDDPAREILEENERAKRLGYGLMWHHVRLAMRYDPATAMVDTGYGKDWRTVKGELLAPMLLDEQKVRTLELGLRSETNIAAQLQQTPKHRTGRLFNVDKINFVDPSLIPTVFDEVVRFWDKAGLEDEGCSTAGGLMGKKRLPDGSFRFYILDMKKGQWGGDQVESEIHVAGLLDLNTYGFEKLRVGVEQEPGSGGKLSAITTQKRLRGIRVEAIPAIGDKPERATPLADAIAMGEVYAPSEAPWMADLLDEMSEFPNSKFKDQVDCLAGAYLMLTAIVGKKKKRTIVTGISRVEICKTPGCKRPASPGGIYCCLNCEVVDSFQDGSICEEHDDECVGRYFEYQQKQ